MELDIFREFVVVLGVSTLLILLFQRIKMPSIIGFLVAGMLMGPTGFRLISEIEQIEILSEIGLVLLLFLIGIEFNLKTLSAIKSTVFIGGGLQVLLSVLLGGLLSYIYGFSVNVSLLIGFMISLSSTAVVIKLFQAQGRINNPEGRNSLAVLIFQDLVAVPMMLLIPVMAGSSGGNTIKILALLVVKTLVVLVLVYLAARYIFPAIMYQVATTKSQELFIIVILLTCFAIAWLTNEAGLSLALGAFLAGLVISESEYSHQAVANVLPFREVFMSFFFISIGLLVDLKFLFQNLHWIVVLALAVIFIKFLTGASALIIHGKSTRLAIITGLALAQIGEFSFVLAKTAIDHKLITAGMNQYFLAVSIVTMLIAPFIIGRIDTICDLLGQTNVPVILSKFNTIIRPGQNEDIESASVNALEDHLVIIGYGINGKNVSRAARYSGIPHVVIEMDGRLVREAKEEGVPVLFGDAIHPEILNSAHVEKARVAVIAISDLAATKRIISAIRLLSQSIYLIVRTRYVREIEELIALGADEVIPEEFETSIEIFSRVLHKYLVPMHQISDVITRIRSTHYELFRPIEARSSSSVDLNIPDLSVAAVQVSKLSSGLTGKKVSESRLRQDYNLNLIAIRRGTEFIQEIKPDEKIQKDDVLYVVGTYDNIAALYRRVSDTGPWGVDE
ncbi:monovalent cation:proton antiporter family protein [Thermaurantimonas aggregans]|uniref:monovalent cation:proton antiporter family protein n=1 Tax=Thermaurantimonas aggregans TaxID=2173829 RepID=UPI0023F3D8E5|nr:monovalent cation:proton antiporter family protein [Thermaurantimonas aggregans]MCX8148559.1 cation:proton antiporter [Thermaurantimonas aggregans]